MNYKKVKKIYLKELLEVYRDKRTLFTTILLPLILYPVIFIGVSSLMTRQTQKMEAETKVIALERFSDYYESSDEEVSYVVKNIEDKLNEVENIKIYQGSGDIDSLLTDGVIHAIMKVDSISFVSPKTYYFEYIYDASNEKSDLAIKEIKKVVGNFEKELIRIRLSKITDLAENEAFLNPLSQEAKMTNIASSQQMLGMVMGRILPYLLIMLLVSGGAVVATDLVAGEKERKTLETLLVSSVTRNEIVLGKFITIVTASLVNVFVNMISMYFSFMHVVSQAGPELTQVNIPFSSFVWVLFSLLPLVALVSAILLTISTYSRNMKESRSFESPLLLGAMMLAMVSMFPGFEMNKGLAFIPIINISLLFKEIMLSGVNYSHYFITLASNLLYSILAIILTLRVFSSEKVLFRTQTETSISAFKKNKAQLITPSVGIVFYIVMLLLLYYIGFGWQREALVDGTINQKALLEGVLKTQIFIIGLPVLLFVSFLFSKKGADKKIARAESRSFLRLKNFNITNLMLVLLMAIPTLVISSWITKVVNYFFPIPEEYFAGMMDLMTADKLPLFALIGVIALAPAIFEELMFRGLIARFFEKSGVWTTILITGILFAIFHLDVYKLLPISFLGIWLAYLLYTGKSIFLPMLAHFLNNLMAVLIGNEIIPMKYALIVEENSMLSVGILVGSLAVFFLLNVVLFKMNKGFEEIS